MTLKELIKTDGFVDFKFKKDNDNNLFSTSGGEVLPSEIYNHNYDMFIGLSSIIEKLNEEVEIIKELKD